MSTPKYTRILSIDGGGIRGIIPGQLLVALENKLRRKNPNARIADYFDMIAGTSTGGILTCALLLPNIKVPQRPKFSAQEVVDLYLKNGEEIFTLPGWQKFKSLWGLSNEKYSEDSLETYLGKIFGTAMLSDLLNPCVVTSYNVEGGHGHFFTQHDARKNPDYNYKLTDVARATSAAPTYFECAQIVSEAGNSSALIDGGVFVNNPALCGYAEAREQFKKGAADMVIFSLGTGYEKKKHEYEKVRDWGAIGWIRPLIDIMMSGVSQVVHHQLHQIYLAVERETQYIRIDPELPDYVNPAMDDASENNRKALAQFGEETAEQFDKELERVVEFVTRME